MLSDTQSEQEMVIACDPSALSKEQMEYWMGVIAPKLYQSVEEIQELPNGFAWRLPSNAETLMLMAEDLNMERLCCPFVHYTVEIEPNQGPFWLKMTGGEGVKAFLRMTFETVNLFDAAVAEAAGFSALTDKDIDSVERVLETVEQINERFAASSEG